MTTHATELRHPRLKQGLSVVERRQLRTEHLPIFRDALSTEIRKETAAARSVLEDGGPAAIEAWVEDFYREREGEMAAAMFPVVLQYGAAVASVALAEAGGSSAPVETFAGTYTETLAGRWTGSSIAQLRQITRDVPEEEEPDEDETTEEMVAGAIEERLVKWEDTRPAWGAERETTQAGGAFAKVAYMAAGVSTLVWAANPGACEFCRRLDGMTVEITRSFMEPGDELRPGDQEERGTLVVRQRIGHPPLHGLDGRGGVCQCLVVAG